jgi:predicted Rossmann fold flavoprotein
VKNLLKRGAVEATIDLFPDTEENELDRRVWRLFEQHKNKTMKNVLPEMLPKQLSEELLAFKSINLTEKKVHEVTKDERKKLVKIMKDLRFRVTGTLGMDKAVIADGGVDLTEVDFKHMTSRLYPNLYLTGDILNINRPSGGFSLQLCWTTAWVSGSDVAET